MREAESDARVLEWLRGSKAVDEQPVPDRPTLRRRRVRMTRSPRTSTGVTYPVEVRNVYDGSHSGVRAAAIADALGRGVDPGEVRATGPARFEFIVR